MALLGLEWAEQDGQLGIRQREQLRRALTNAGDFLGWVTIETDPIQTACRDVTKLARTGARSIKRELADEVATKKSELSELKKATSAIQKLAEGADFTDPVEVSYAYTARESQDLVTRVETLTLADAEEALEAAAIMEKKMATWGKLREEMLAELKQRKRQVDAWADDLSAFVESTQGMVREVISIL